MSERDWVTAGRPDNRGSTPYNGRSIFFPPQRPDRLWNPHSLLANGHCGVKRPLLRDGHSNASCAEFKYEWNHIAIPHTSTWRGG
jgi:hypothetical protein